MYPGVPVYQYPTLLNCVLSPASRDYSSHLPGCSSTRQICTLHHDPGYVQVPH